MIDRASVIINWKRSEFVGSRFWWGVIQGYLSLYVSWRDHSVIDTNGTCGLRGMNYFRRAWGKDLSWRHQRIDYSCLWGAPFGIIRVRYFSRANGVVPSKQWSVRWCGGEKMAGKVFFWWVNFWRGGIPKRRHRFDDAAVPTLIRTNLVFWNWLRLHQNSISYSSKFNQVLQKMQQIRSFEVLHLQYFIDMVELCCIWNCIWNSYI